MNSPAEYDQVIEHGAEALRPGRRLVILDLKQPAGVPLWLVKLGVLFASPFGVSLDLAGRHPWESVASHLNPVSFVELYFGFVYITMGEIGPLPHATVDLSPAHRF